MSHHYIIIPVVSAAVSVACVSALTLAARRLRLLTAHNGVPLVGGIAIAFVYVLSLEVFFREALVSPERILFVCAAFLVFASGLWDDIWELSVAVKIVCQCLACGLLIWSGVRTRIFLLNDAGNIVVTVIWVLGITNAFNLLDIMDGLCAGITVIVALGLFAICVMSGQVRTAQMLLVMIGAASGFLALNMPPAKAYLGNAGSHFLGFLLAAFSIQIGYATLAKQTALISPVFIMGFPVFDTVFVALMRITNGRSAFKKSKDHLALRFLKLGHSEAHALIFMFGGAALFASCGVILSQVPQNIGVFIVLAVLLSAVACTRVMSRVSLND